MILSLLLTVLAPLQQSSAPRHSLVTVDLADAGWTAGELRRADFDVVFRRPGTSVYELVATADDLSRLEALGLRYAVEHADLGAFYAGRAAAEGAPEAPARGAWLSPPFGQGSMGGFYTFAEVESVLDQITAAYPTLTTAKASIGASLEGRELWAVKISDNPGVNEAEPEVRFDAMHHAREPESMQTVIWTMLTLLEGYGTDPLATYLVNEREMWFVPVVNPDGYVYNETTNPNGGGMWRKNRRDNGGGVFGVDLNRNYSFQWGYDDNGSSPSPSNETYRGPSAASEPEVVAMQAFISSRSFRTAISAHTYSNVWLSPWGYIAQGPANAADYDEISRLQTAVNGYVYGPAGIVLYLGNGVTIDYDHGVHGTMSWLPEIGSSADGFWPPPSRIEPLAQENEQGFLRTALAAGAYVHELDLALVDLGDGDGNLEPGESFEAVLTVRNSGRDGASVNATLSSSSAELSIGSGAASLGFVGSFASADNAGAPFTFTVDPSADLGATLTLTTAVDYEGYVETRDRVLLVGDPRPFVSDDVEVDLGWLAGLPGDTATAGVWEFGDPVGTSYNGQPSNPENDATPGPGVSCFTTGNGSTSAGGDDVDDGFTTLVTPRIDLSGVAAAVVSYSRWYANLNNPDDDFEVSISDDDGATWTPLETVRGAQNAWTPVSFVVGDFVDLTDSIRLRFVASDDPNNSLVEGAIDELSIVAYDEIPRMNIYGSPAVGTLLALHVAGEPGEIYAVHTSPGTANFTLPNGWGPILLDTSQMAKLVQGVIPGGGLARPVNVIPNDPGLIGETFYVQAVTVGGAGVRFSNRAEITFE